MQEDERKESVGRTGLITKQPKIPCSLAPWEWEGSGVVRVTQSYHTVGRTAWIAAYLMAIPSRHWLLAADPVGRAAFWRHLTRERKPAREKRSESRLARTSYADILLGRVVL